MLSIAESWVWDFWLADDGDSIHAFFLNAPRSLGDPRRRHRAARIGHAVSRTADLSTWTVGGKPFDVGDRGSFDETATWTGSVVRGDDGLWRMFYTGARFLHEEPRQTTVETGIVQSVGVAVSADLENWKKLPGPVTQADSRWYETFDPEGWNEEAWRDPWVFRDPDGMGWHMLVTARANHGPLDDRGVIGHAFSDDLETWTVLPPLSAPGSGFSHLEVPQVELIDGQWMLFFSCAREALSSAHATIHPDPGAWAVPIDDPVGVFDVSRARPITSSRLYSTRAIRQRNGRWALLGFLNARADEYLPGGIADPLPLSIDPASRYPVVGVRSHAADAVPLESLHLNPAHPCIH
jgi:beta-fructofuranosidase